MLLLLQYSDSKPIVVAAPDVGWMVSVIRCVASGCLSAVRCYRAVLFPLPFQ